jgi:hypothetical protein
VSLAFLELFVRENSADATMTANDVVNAHVKPHIKGIGGDGSGAFVELIGTHVVVLVVVLGGDDRGSVAQV